MSAQKELQQHQPELTFPPAASGFRVRLVTGLTVTVFVVLLIVDAIVVPRASGRGYVIAVLAPLGGLLIVSIVWLASRIRFYRLVNESLVVERLIRTRSFALAGLEGVAHEPGAPARALKIIGNDGLGAMAGRFRSKKLGRFRAYLTDGDKAVVLRWAERTLVVSPEHPADFVAAVRRRAGVCSRR